MQQAAEITLRDIPNSDAVKVHIQDEVDKLSHFFENIVSCHVVIELSQNNRQTGKLHNARVSISVPGKQLISNHNENENLYSSIREAFDDMKRQLQTYSERAHGMVKHHAEQYPGKVVRLFSDKGFGFIEGPDGNEYYFNEGYVHRKDFNRIHVGDAVRFIIGVGNDGLQAHSVNILSG